MAENGVVKIDGKTFYRVGTTYTRMKDRNYDGKRTVYNKCSNCGKLISRQWQSYHRSFCNNKHK